MNIRILDCTLRDGGYINNWEFGQRNISGVIKGLTSAGIDIVECGFLQDKSHNQEQSLYNSIAEIQKFLLANEEKTRYVVMMNSGGFPVDKLKNEESNLIFGIRIVFHINQMENALRECREIRNKGYRAFLQPMGTDCYTDKSLLDLVEKANDIEPYAFYFVDSLGVMNSDDIVRIALLLHNNLKPDIIMGFHSHNNLQLAFSNVQKLINMRLKRELIVDSSVYGMGRGAGNLHTELISNYINEMYNADYNTDRILRVYDEHIKSFYEKYNWGYSIPYYLAAVHKCHPNYGTYLINRATLPITDIGVLLSGIPSENKRVYSEKFIEDKYRDYVADKTDDTVACKLLCNEIQGRQVLLIGPAKSQNTHSTVIKNYIESNKPVVISINHVPEKITINFAFFSNRKRFEERCSDDARLILTSNIKHELNDVIIVDYLSLCNQKGRFSDNAAVMLLSLLVRLNCDAVSIAGLDGYSGNDYYDEKMRHLATREWMESTNAAVSAAIKQFSKSMKITFITPSLYDNE